MFLDSLKYDFSIIGITESWLKPSNVNNYTPDNYNHEYDIRSTSPGGRTSLFMSDKLKYIVSNDIHFDKKLSINSIAIELDSILSRAVNPWKYYLYIGRQRCPLLISLWD